MDSDARVTLDSQSSVDLTSRSSGRFAGGFDAVVMLTWSDWRTEPRSNRYHYATRFARHVPTFFVQVTDPVDSDHLEATEIANLQIVHVGSEYGQRAADVLSGALANAGVRNPLIWIYNPNFDFLLHRYAQSTIVYHATEAYFTTEGAVKSTADPTSLHPALCRVLNQCDLLVSVSAAVEQSYLERGVFWGRSIVLPNGCDFDFWRASGASNFSPQPSGRPIALFQGGLNARVDYDLLRQLVDKMPDWDFAFCGRVTSTPGWTELLEVSRLNVRYFGELPIEKVAELARYATVGIIPFKDAPVIRQSLPLKAYEYVACGLPVVSVPVDALADAPDLFRIATSADEFAQALRQLAPTRSDPTTIQKRLEAASGMSYEKNFVTLSRELQTIVSETRPAGDSKNILVLYDSRSTHVSTIREHLESFAAYSTNRVYYLAVTGALEAEGRLVPDEWDFDLFDVIVVHYCVRLSVDGHMNPDVTGALSRFAGLKILYIQDEYDTVETTRRTMDMVQFDVVYTCVPAAWVDSVYPSGRFAKTTFLPTLTGYIPSSLMHRRRPRPMATRDLRIAYRGRDLPHHYGDLAREKYTIGLEMKRLASERSIPVDIAVDHQSRIYGPGWYTFLESARATLGTESGSNVFDFDGSLSKLSRQHSEMPYEEFRRRYLVGNEGPVQMNQISPKIFEAIAVGTALVLFEGDYSGVVQPDVHYIPLKKDYSNVGEVFAKLEDLAYLEEITARAYRDVIASGRYSYRAFIEGFDALLADRLLKPSAARILSSPAVVLRRGQAQGQRAYASCTSALACTLSDQVLSWDEREMVLLARQSISGKPNVVVRDVVDPAIEIIGHGISVQATAPADNVVRRNPVKGVARLVLRPVWKVLPTGVRTRVIKVLEKRGPS